MNVFFNVSDKENPFAIESIGFNWRQEPTTRIEGYPYYHWLQSYEGNGVIKINQESFDLTPGQGILIAPFIPHEYYQTSQGTWRTNFVTIGGTLAPEIPKIIGTKAFYLAQDHEGFSFTQWNRTLLERLDQTGTFSSADASVAAFTFLTKLTESYAQTERQQDERFTDSVQPILNWIEENYFMPCSTTTLAQLVYISPQYLSRLFQRFMGLSPYQYVTAFRIKKAKELLVTQPQLRIRDLSSQVGFNDVSHFIATFKKETSYTPEQFRKLH